MNAEVMVAMRKQRRHRRSAWSPKGNKAMMPGYEKMDNTEVKAWADSLDPEPFIRFAQRMRERGFVSHEEDQ